jgi:hypothetical protein
MIQCRILKTVDDIIAKFALYRQYDHSAWRAVVFTFSTDLPSNDVALCN